VIAGFLHASEIEKLVNEANISSSDRAEGIASLTYLAGQQHADETHCRG